MKKQFTETIVGKFLFSNVGRGLAKSIPVVGPLLGNILNDNNSAQGKIDKDEIKSDIAQAAIILVVLAYLLGWLDFEQAEAAKELIGE